MKSLAFVRLSFALAAAAVSAAALAIPITYTIAGTGSGSLNGTSFTNAAFSVSAANDTSNVDAVNANFYRILPVTTTVSVTGLGSDILTGPIQLACNRTVHRAGFGDTTNNFAVIFVDNATFTTYDLKTSIGPVPGAPIFNGGQSYFTAGGSFRLDNVSNATFTAQAVPEPASLLALGAGVAAFARRRRRA